MCTGQKKYQGFVVPDADASPGMQLHSQVLYTMQEYQAGMQLPDILQLIAVLVECAVTVLSVLIAVRNKKVYGWFIAVTFALFVLFDIARIFLLPLSNEVHALIFLVACGSMLYAVWLLYKEK